MFLPVYLPLRPCVQTQKSRDKHSLSKALKCLWFGSSGYINVCIEVSGSPTSHSSGYLTLNVSLGSQLWEQQHSQLDCAHLPTLLSPHPFPSLPGFYRAPHSSYKGWGHIQLAQETTVSGFRSNNMSLAQGSKAGHEAFLGTSKVHMEKKSTIWCRNDRFSEQFHWYKPHLSYKQKPKCNKLFLGFYWPIIFCSRRPFPFPKRTQRSRILGISNRKLL